MRMINNWLLPMLLVAATLSAPGAVVVGTSLNIGDGGSGNNSVSTLQSGSIGLGNGVSAPFSLAIGEYNIIDRDDADETSSFAFGRYNTVVGFGSMVGGYMNAVYDHNSMTVGSHNYNNSTNSLVVGTSHTMSYNYFRNSIVCGKYSEDVPGKPLYLAVGNGDASERSNAFTVFEDGDVVISKPQGDISMGVYE